MPKLRRTLFIGLGGTGMKSILETKRMLYENYKDIPPMIAFLGIDTDGPGFETATLTAKDGTPISLKTSETLAITVSEPHDIFRHSPDRFQWMPEGNIPGLDQLSIGAGQMRSNGRFAITNKENDVINRLNNSLDKVNNADIIDNEKYSVLGADTEVHVVFSLSGGTGAGTFLNLAYLLKRIAPTAKISGYAVLADVFKSQLSGAMSARVRPNALGAIKDVDFLTHLTLDSDPVELHWMRTVDKITERPFRALYLIDNKNANNDSFTSIIPLCQMISLALVTNVGALGVAMNSISDNVTKQISDGVMDILDKKAWVSGIGVAEIVFDGATLSRIYAQKAKIQIVNMLLNGGCDDPAVLAGAWFDANSIRENNGRDDVIDYFAKPTPKFAFNNIDNPDAPKQDIETYFNTVAYEKRGVMEEKLRELKTRIDMSLSEEMAKQVNRECGVFLAENILKSILTLVNICDGEMKEEIDDLTDNLPRFQSALDTACKELEDCMGTFLKRKRKDYEEEVVNATMNLTKQNREIERRKMAREFYSWLHNRVIESLNRVDIIINNLRAVRDESNSELLAIRQRMGASTFFQFDLSTDLADSIQCSVQDIVFNDFIQAVKPQGGVAAFAVMTSSETDNEILSFVNRMSPVKALADKTVDEALAELSEEQLINLVQRALRKSMPLLPYTYHGHDADVKPGGQPVDSYYIGVADKEKSIINKKLLQRILSGDQPVDFSETGLKDRVIIYRQIGVLPAFTIKSLDNYKVEYQRFEEQKPFTSHWDRAMCERMKKERHQLWPKNPVAEKLILEAWVNALINGLVVFNSATGSYQVRSRGLGGSALKNWMVDMGQSRTKAFDFFKDNFDVLEEELETELGKMDIPGPDNRLRKNMEKASRAVSDGRYLEEVSQCPIAMSDLELYPDEYKLIEKELEYLYDKLHS